MLNDGSRVCRSLYIGVLRVVFRQDVGAQAQVIWRAGMKVEQDVPERLASRVSICFDRMTPVVGEHLTRQRGDRLYVPGILQKQYVVAVQTDGAMMRVSVEKVLTEIHDRQVAMVRKFGEYVDHETVGDRHEIVEDEETGFRAVEDGVRLCRQTLAEIHVVAVLVEFRLPLPVTVSYPLYRRFEQFAAEYGVIVFPLPVAPETRNVDGCKSGNIVQENVANRAYIRFPPPGREGGG